MKDLWIQKWRVQERAARQAEFVLAPKETATYELARTSELRAQPVEKVE